MKKGEREHIKGSESRSHIKRGRSCIRIAMNYIK